MTRVVGTGWLDLMLAEYWETATVHAYLLDSATSFDPSTDLTLDDILEADRVSGPVTVTGKTAAAGFFDATDLVFTLADGDEAGWVVLVIDGASEALSPVIVAYSEHADGSPIAYEGNGGAVGYQFQALGAGRI